MTMGKITLMFAALAFVAGCASKKTQTEAPAAPAAAPATAPAVTETKVEKKAGEKKTEATKMTRPTKTAQADPNAKETKCTSGSDERLLTVNPKDGGCELQYTKAGEMKIIATQVSGDARCVEVMNNVKKNLEGAKFTCQ